MKTLNRREVSVTLVLALELALGPVRRSLLAWRGDERAQR